MSSRSLVEDFSSSISGIFLHLYLKVPPEPRVTMGTTAQCHRDPYWVRQNRKAGLLTPLEYQLDPVEMLSIGLAQWCAYSSRF